jgi:hypothetical protein
MLCRPLQMGQDVKTFVSHMNSYHRMTSEERRVDGRTCFVDISQTPPPATPVITPWSSEQNGYGGRDRGYVWGKQHGVPLTKVFWSLWTLALN